MSKNFVNIIEKRLASVPEDKKQAFLDGAIFGMEQARTIYNTPRKIRDLLELSKLQF